MKKLLSFEEKLWSQGIDYIAGIDESGRGPLAGPVIAAAVIFPRSVFITGVNDSKKLTAREREYLYPIIRNKAIAVGIGVVDEKAIDEHNILQATYKAMELSVLNLSIAPQHVLVDGYKNPRFSNNQTAIIKGDSLCFSIAAASIIAKVTRDRIMIDYEKIYPQYGFAQHKGYPTPQHIRAIQQYGLCSIHRKSFKINIYTDQ